MTQERQAFRESRFHPNGIGETEKFLFLNEWSGIKWLFYAQRRDSNGNVSRLK